MDEARTILFDVLMEDLANTSEMPQGSEEHAKAIDSAVKLYKLKIEEEKNASEAEARLKAQEEEIAFKRKIAADENRWRYIKLVMDGVVLIVPLMCYNHWYKQGLLFEETGTFRSKMVNNLLGKIRPGK